MSARQLATQIWCKSVHGGFSANIVTFYLYNIWDFSCFFLFWFKPDPSLMSLLMSVVCLQVVDYNKQLEEEFNME